MAQVVRLPAGRTTDRGAVHAARPSRDVGLLERARIGSELLGYYEAEYGIVLPDGLVRSLAELVRPADRAGMAVSDRR